MSQPVGGHTFKQWLVWYLRQPFRLIVWFMETFSNNRARLAAFMAKDGVAKTVKTIIVLTFFVWLAVFAFLASDEQGQRLSCAVKSLVPGAESSADCGPQPWQKTPPAN